jgi:hypothetical protein
MRIIIDRDYLREGKRETTRGTGREVERRDGNELEGR